MGTKFEYAVNLLANSPVGSSRTRTFSLKFVDDCQKSQNGDLRSERRVEKRGIHNFREEEQEEEPMERNEEIQNIESIKKTMQMHEDTFRQQVRELHRLYNVQRMLMGEAKKQVEQSTRSPLTTATTSLTRNNSLSWPCKAFPSPGNDPSPGNFDLERPIKGDVLNHGELGDGCSMEEHEVELTLSIGGKMSKRKPKIEVEKKFVSSLSIESDRSDPAPDSSVSDRERKRPHWLFRV